MTFNFSLILMPHLLIAVEGNGCGARKTAKEQTKISRATTVHSLLFFYSAYTRPEDCFAKVPKSFRTSKTTAKSRGVLLQRCFIHIFSKWRLQTARISCDFPLVDGFCHINFRSFCKIEIQWKIKAVIFKYASVQNLIKQLFHLRLIWDWL